MMLKKRVVTHLLSALLLFQGQTFADNSQDLGNQALASLLFHTKQLLDSPTEDDKIVFTKEDTDNLWESAENLNNENIRNAHTAFELWEHNFSSPAGAEALEDCTALLHTEWMKFVEKDFLETAESSDKVVHDYFASNLNGNPLAKSSTRKKVLPYVLPENHPIAAIVNEIFKTRVTFNKQTLLGSGFSILASQPRSFIAVARHPALPGYLFKLYYDTELRKKRDHEGWLWFVRRCRGAEKVRKVIARHHLKHFTVPDKYIYVLPANTAPEKSSQVDPKLAVLVVTDMQLLPSQVNQQMWKTALNEEILKELYLIVSEAGGSSYRPDNVSFTVHGNLAFIDTEYPNEKPHFDGIRAYLPSNLKGYWDTLVSTGGAPRKKK